MGRFFYLMIWLAAWPLSHLLLPTPDEAETPVPWGRVALCCAVALLLTGAVALLWVCVA